MSTDPPAAGMPTDNSTPIEPDPKADGSNARRASGARRSRRKKEDDEPKPKKQVAKRSSKHAYVSSLVQLQRLLTLYIDPKK